MAVKINLTNSRNWWGKHTWSMDRKVSHPIGKDGNAGTQGTCTFTGEIGDWLKIRGHPGTFTIFYGKYATHDEAHMTFEDESLAMLFKLTWL